MQLPQFAGSVLRLASQPLEAIPSQFPVPVEHEVVTHVPAVHVVPAPHTVPHIPQFAPLVARLASQPFAAILSQSAYPALQLPSAQAPPAQLAVAFGYEHAAPHAPQFATLVPMLLSHPSARLALQSANPGRQMLHVPEAPHARLPLAQSALLQHALQPADAPQQCVAPLQVLCWHVPVAQTSVVHALLSTQSPLEQHCAHRPPPQSMRPVGHAHAPIEQNWVAPHALPQRPQLPAATRVSTSQPSAAIPLQSAKPARHAKPHVPDAQSADAFARVAHAVPHAPQLVTSVAVVTHDGPHNVSVTAQPAAQPLAPHTAVAPEHVTPHAPQLAGSLAAVLHAKLDPHERNAGLQWHTPALHVAFAPHE
jgi:hypothetical protein